MSIRGQTAIVGIGEIPTARSYSGRSVFSLCAEAVRLALADAGLRKQDIDGLFVEPVGGGPAGGSPAVMAEALGLQPPLFSLGVSMMGATGATATAMAASAITSGMCNYALVVLGASREAGPPAGGPPPSLGTEWENPFGPAPGANTGYALMYQRHMYEYGTKPEQFAKLAVDQRFNALNNPNAAFRGQPITIEDVLNSRYVNAPLHLLECVMPSAGAAACIITSAERAQALPNRPVYILGAGIEQFVENIWQRDRITVAPASGSARRAFAMAGYSPRDMEFAEFYDWYTILVAVCLEDAGFCKKGEIGLFYESTDTTYKGTFPINTDGGQISGGQPGLAGGFRHVVEAARQIMGKADARQVARNNLCMVNGWGGTAGEMCSLVLGSGDTL